MNRGLVHLIGNLAPIVSGIITAPLTARALGVEQRGVLAIVLIAYSAIVAIGAFGVGWLARAEVARDRYTALYWRSLAPLVSGFFLPFAVLVGIATTLILGVNGVDQVLVVVLCAVGAFSASRSVDGNILISSGRQGSYGSINLIYTCVVVAAIVVSFVFDRLTLGVAVFANVLGAIVQLAMLAVAGHRLISSERVRYQTRRTEMRASTEWGYRSVIRQGAVAWRSQILDMSLTKSDTFLSGLSGSARSVGYYSVVQILPQVSYGLFNTIVQRSFSVRPKATANDRLGALATVCLVTSAGLCVVALPVAWWGIPVVFGSDFLGARALLPAGIAVTFGLSAMAPVLQDAVRRPRTGRAAIACVAVPVVLGVCFSFVATPLIAISIFGLFATLSGWAYVLWFVRRGILAWSPRNAFKFIRG